MGYQTSSEISKWFLEMYKNDLVFSLKYQYCIVSDSLSRRVENIPWWKSRVCYKRQIILNNLIWTHTHVCVYICIWFLKSAFLSTDVSSVWSRVKVSVHDWVQKQMKGISDDYPRDTMHLSLGAYMPYKASGYFSTFTTCPSKCHTS